MLVSMESIAPELGLLLASARVRTNQAEEAKIRQMLDEGIDWTCFARKAIDHGLATLAGHTLSRVALDLVPADILEALRMNVEQARRTNRALFDELAGVIAALNRGGVEAIPFNGPVLAIQSYGDLGLRVLRGLDFLVHDSDLACTIGILRDLGYEREQTLTVSQIELIQRLQGQDFVYRKAAGIGIRPHARLTPFKMALDIDYAGLWRRARRTNLNGQTMLTLAPEDDFLALAIHGGKKMWRDMRSVSDAAAFIGSHPELDWNALTERARLQGCLRIVLLTTSLARKYFNSTVPDAVIAAEHKNPFIEPMVARIVADWQTDKGMRPGGDKIRYMDRLALHDGVLRRARYAMRALFLPEPHHVAARPLPRGLHFAYVPIKIGHDIAQTWSRVRGRLPAKKVRDVVEAIGKKAKLPDEPNHNSQDPGWWMARARSFMNTNRFAEAVEASDSALALDPANTAAARVGITSRLQACDWHRREQDKQDITEGLRAGRVMISPFFHRNISDSEAESLVLARIAAKEFTRPAKPVWQGETYRHDKIRIAYLSTDFRDHVVSDVMAGCFDHHDKMRFETTAISLGPDDASAMRRRIEVAVDRFIDAKAMSDARIAAILRELEIDIAIDLNGYSGRNRTGILAHRPAPVQVNYLGYPGTMGVPYFDYIIADHIVMPRGQQTHYTEKVVYMPRAYLPYDGNRRIAEKTPSRGEAGLPETDFVFACHNAPNKLGPEMFDVWMRLLQTVEGSVLWLKSLNPAAIGNLWHEARARGVAPDRLVFAPRLPYTEYHLARLRLADLFLDTLPYNAHATAWDALWVGLPVLTCIGNTFPGRVAASLLHAVGLPELVTTSLAEYEQLAVALARDPQRLGAIRAKLVTNRDTKPLFDAARFTRDLESAYETMWERTQRGEPPESFSIGSALHSTV